MTFANFKTMLERKPTHRIISGDKRIMKDLFADQHTINTPKTRPCPRIQPRKNTARSTHNHNIHILISSKDL